MTEPRKDLTAELRARDKSRANDAKVKYLPEDQQKLDQLQKEYDKAVDKLDVDAQWRINGKMREIELKYLNGKLRSDAKDVSYRSGKMGKDADPAPKVKVFQKSDGWYWQPSLSGWGAVGAFKTEAAAQREADKWLKDHQEFLPRLLRGLTKDAKPAREMTKREIEAEISDIKSRPATGTQEGRARLQALKTVLMEKEMRGEDEITKQAKDAATWRSPKIAAE